MTNRYFVTFDPHTLIITKVGLAVTQNNNQYEGRGYCYVRAADELGAFVAVVSRLKEPWAQA
jgi:hypothetical protein